MEIQENINDMVEEHKSISDDIDSEPIKLTKTDLQDILLESGISKDNSAKIEDFYIENFNDNLPPAENLLDGKILKANEQRKKERALEKQVDFLKNKLEQFNLKDGDEDYDIVLHVKPEKVQEIKSQIIDGQECIIIPINENEKTTINELK